MCVIVGIVYFSLWLWCIVIRCGAYGYTREDGMINGDINDSFNVLDCLDCCRRTNYWQRLLGSVYFAMKGYEINICIVMSFFNHPNHI